MSLKQRIKNKIKKVLRRLRPRLKSTHQGEAPHKLADVIEHYERLTPIYQEVYGEVFQAGRPYDIEELLVHELTSIQIDDGQHILDAGCGVCGPAIWFARHKQVTIDAITISPKQVFAAQQNIDAAGLSSRIKVQLADYHRFEDFFPLNSFDRVFFLESICHAESYERVLASAWKVLKPNGCIYVKDYTERDFRDDPERYKRSKEFLKKVYAEYSFTMLRSWEMTEMLEKIGFKVELLKPIPFVAEKENISIQVDFEKKAGFHWRDGLDFWLPELIEVRARKPA